MGNQCQGIHGFEFPTAEVNVSEIQRDSSPGPKILCDKLLVRVSHNKWKKIDQRGFSPVERSGHASVTIRSKVYMFGGCGGTPNSGGCLGDFHSFDFTTSTWSVVKWTGHIPTPRASFAMCTGPLPGTIVLSGGTSDSGLHDDMFEFNTYTRKWRKLTGTCPKDHTGPSRFCRLYGQSMCSFKRKIYFFGGSSGHHYSNDTVCYDIDTQIWHKVETRNAPPSPRYKHQALIIGNTMLIIGGGCYRPTAQLLEVFGLDLQTLEWSQYNCSGSIPEARVAHSCDYDEESQSIVLWGGFTKSLSRLGDFYILHLPSLRWFEINCDRRFSPSPRAFHSCCLHQNNFYIFGGADGETRFADVWSYELRQSPPTLMTLCARNQAFSPSDQPKVSEEVLKGIKSVENGFSWVSQRCELPEPTLKRALENTDKSGQESENRVGKTMKLPVKNSLGLFGQIISIHH